MDTVSKDEALNLSSQEIERLTHEISSPEALDSEVPTPEVPETPKESGPVILTREFEKLFNVVDRILENVEKSVKQYAEYRIFRVVVPASVNIVYEDLLKMHDHISALFPSSDFTKIIEKLEPLRASSYTSPRKMKNQPVLQIKFIYEIAKQRQKEINDRILLSNSTGKDISDIKIELGPEIFRLHLARIFNMVKENEHLAKEIEGLELRLRTGNSPTSVVEIPTLPFGQLGSVINSFMGSNNINMTGMEKHANSFIQSAKDYATPEMLQALMSGDMKAIGNKVKGSIKKNKNLVQAFRDLADNPMVNDLVGTAAGYATKFGVNISDMTDIDINNLKLTDIIDKVEKDLDKLGDDDEVGKSEANDGEEDGVSDTPATKDESADATEPKEEPSAEA